jgi:hypothetical protein
VLAFHDDSQRHLCVWVQQLALWTAGIVVCTLVVNAPLMPLILRWTRLSDISPVKVRMRGKAARALLRYTHTAIEDLQHDEDEMLRGELQRFNFEIRKAHVASPAREVTTRQRNLRKGR